MPEGGSPTNAGLHGLPHPGPPRPAATACHGPPPPPHASPSLRCGAGTQHSRSEGLAINRRDHPACRARQGLALGRAGLRSEFWSGLAGAGWLERALERRVLSGANPLHLAHLGSGAAPVLLRCCSAAPPATGPGSHSPLSKTLPAEVSSGVLLAASRLHYADGRAPPPGPALWPWSRTCRQNPAKLEYVHWKCGCRTHFDSIFVQNVMFVLALKSL